MPMRRQVLMTRQGISPRLAMRILENILGTPILLVRAPVVSERNRKAAGDCELGIAIPLGRLAAFYQDKAVPCTEAFIVVNQLVHVICYGGPFTIAAFDIQPC